MNKAFKALAGLIALAALAACGGSAGGTGAGGIGDGGGGGGSGGGGGDDQGTQITEDLRPKWCWSMQSGALLGSFRTDGMQPGDGTASPGIYSIQEFSVLQSSFTDIEVGSTSNGIYAFGSQPEYQINWDGSAVTGFWRGSLSTRYTNGFGVYNGADGAGATLVFDVDYQRAETEGDGDLIFVSRTTPAVTPAGSSGTCPREGGPP